MEETMCNGNTSLLVFVDWWRWHLCVVTKLKTSNRSKYEIMTMDHCFRKCGDNGCVPCNTTCNGSTPCIAWVASYASLRSKYDELCFFNPFFSKMTFAKPLFFFRVLANFRHQKSLLRPLTFINYGPLEKVIKAHFKSNQGPLKRRSNYQGHIDGLDGTRIERHTRRRPSEKDL